MAKGYWIASGQFLKGIRKPLGNAHRTQIPVGQMFLLAVWVCDKILGNEAISQKETRQNCPVAIGKSLECPCLLSEVLYF
jgi:hypothetical protein